MPTFFSEYLFPKNPIAFGIIAFLIGFFSVWCIGLIRYWRWLRSERKQTENNENIQWLVAARQKWDSERENSDSKAYAENVFDKFCEERSVGKRSPIIKHLQAIFLAGWKETRLEVGDLINHTTSDLFKWNNLFRSVLAVFIVIGLLGTLFGLAESLTKLSPALKASMVNEAPIEENEESSANGSTTENSDRMTQALGGLLDKMKGALAPSIWGIIFTVGGVILYSFYLQYACYPVKSTLERLTLTIWVPQLYPTTSQKLVQTLHESEAQMRSGYQTAAQVGELVGNVQSNISEFNENLTRANAITQPLSESVSRINVAADVFNEVFTRKLQKFLHEFAENVTRLTDFQAEIRNLYQQLKDESETFQQGANQRLDKQTQKLEEQNQNLTTTVEVLKNSEKLYVESCQQIDNTLQEFLSKTAEASTNIETTNKKFLEGINTSNREWIKEIQTQLKTDLAIIQPTLKEELKTLTKQLTTDLKEVQRTQDEGLTALTDQLKFFQLPIEKTADQIEGTIESFTRIMEGIVKNLQSEFQKQNKTIKEQNEKYEAQLTGVKNLSKSVLNLLNQLDENSKNQRDAVNALNSNVGELTKDTKHLATAIESFTSDSETLSQSIATIEEHTETLGTASQQFVEKVEKADVTPLTANIGKLNVSINEISQHSQTLANSVNILARQVNSLGSSPPNLMKQKIPLLERIRILFLGSPSATHTRTKSQSKNNESESTDSNT